MTIKNRLAKLEKRRPRKAGRAYIAVADEADLEGLDIPRGIKVYLGGISPDDWDEVTHDDQKQTEQAGAESQP